ncbi:MAG: M23 family metallopeptidase [Anaerolineaceae bacterium]|nr:M23 family metallopeptidase [Anaerolineaceae bacterium]
MKALLKLGVLAFVFFLVAGIYFILRRPGNTGRNLKLYQFLDDPQGHAGWMMRAEERCGDAPFLFPTDGYIGFLWDDSFRPGHRHQGIDIFGGTEGGKTPVFAAYDGYLTRRQDWKSTVIIRIPDDPLQPGRQIWTYYTHMADPDGASFISPVFPPGTEEVSVKAGTLLGMQGNYSGSPGNPTGVHLHFSIVQDDGRGSYQNELEIKNTLDPTAYFGLPLNSHQNEGVIPLCQ